jgi:hypothetical protein
MLEVFCTYRHKLEKELTYRVAKNVPDNTLEDLNYTDISIVNVSYFNRHKNHGQFLDTSSGISFVSPMPGF